MAVTHFQVILPCATKYNILSNEKQVPIWENFQRKLPASKKHDSCTSEFKQDVFASEMFSPGPSHLAEGNPDTSYKAASITRIKQHSELFLKAYRKRNTMLRSDDARHSGTLHHAEYTYRTS